jgi:hypothetical protein
MKNRQHEGQKLALMMQATHLEKLVFFNMSDAKLNDTIDIQKTVT